MIFLRVHACATVKIAKNLSSLSYRNVICTPQNKDNLIRHSIVLSLAGLAVIVIGYI